jgi:hypothetical protein
MPLNLPTARQTPNDLAVLQISERVRFDTVGIGGTFYVGTLPPGAVIQRTVVHIVTAFNAATTNVLIVGTAAAGAQLMADATAAAGTLGTKVVNGVASGSPVVGAADQPIFVRYTQSGTAATAGEAIVSVEYLPRVQ